MLNDLLSSSQEEAGGLVADSEPGPAQREMADLKLGAGLVTCLVLQSFSVRIVQSLSHLQPFPSVRPTHER